ncbi:MAG: ABC transporter ATP-binding protein/permease [Defluviitaleaceae bacterium]|nr:ABC transporter ATP-binding protein/permease [Defluviitaleaceae bacterium]MCL2273940.1 ABC transporter ATP-binding protein/permease [Defluviitaleaceae bacterium]
MKIFTATIKNANFRYAPVLVLYIFATCGAAVALVVMNRLSGQMGEAALYENTSTLIRLLILLTGVMAVRAVFSAAATFSMARCASEVGYGLRGNFVRYFLRVPFFQVERAASGERLSLFTNDAPKAEQLVATGLFDLISDFISFVSAFVFLLILSPRFTGISFLAAIGMLILQVALAMPLQRWATRMSEKKAAFNAVVNDSLQNLSLVAAYNLEELLEARYMHVYGQYFAALKKFAVSLGIMVGSMMAILMSPLIVIFTILAFAVIGGEMTLAEFIAFVTTVTIASGSVMMLAQNVGRLAEAMAGAKRLHENTDFPLENTAETDTLTPQITGDITFNNVSFAYNAEDETPTYALENASFTIRGGSRVAIVGASGSGKSTILKLLLGLYRPTAGSITINGQDISQGDGMRGLRASCAYVPQDSFLFPVSIGENIAAGGEIRLADMEKACAQAGILDFIQSLPDQFNGTLTEAADNISGGQRQRLAMARAFYKNAPIILFDEATASLDPATEAAVLAGFAEATRGKTVIMVAHRPQAIAACDVVIHVSEGRITA